MRYILVGIPFHFVKNGVTHSIEIAATVGKSDNDKCFTFLGIKEALWSNPIRGTDGWYKTSLTPEEIGSIDVRASSAFYSVLNKKVKAQLGFPLVN